MSESDLLGRIGLEFCVEGPAIICCLCRFAIAATVVKLHDHLRDRHRISISQRRAAVEHFQHLHAEADQSLGQSHQFVSPRLPFTMDSSACEAALSPSARLQWSAKCLVSISFRDQICHTTRCIVMLSCRHGCQEIGLSTGRSWSPDHPISFPAPPSLSLHKFLEDLHR